jgi:DNA-binding beta-propeller fold protein YncE
MSDTQGRVFVLEASDGGHVFALNPDGSGKHVLVSGCRIPDGITVDADRGHIYWTNMGTPAANDGSIERVSLHGTDRVTIVPPGGTHTPKQLHLDTASRKLYWADRGDPPRGNTVNRAPMGASRDQREAPEILWTHLEGASASASPWLATACG